METTARGDVPKTLQTIAYISIPKSADLEFLLWDLQDAIAAYAQISGTALPHPVDLEADDAGSVAGTADGIVFAVEDAPNDEAMAPIEQVLDRFGGAGTRAYVVVQADIGGLERAHGSSCVCERRATFVGCHGAAALSPVPAAASRRFVTHRAWDSCGDRFRKRWTSS